MEKNPGDQYIFLIVATLLIVSVPFGLFPWAALGTVGLAAIQAGLQGFRSTGYGIVGHARLTGNSARILGGITIAIGVIWEIVLIGFLLYGFSLFP